MSRKNTGLFSFMCTYQSIDIVQSIGQQLLEPYIESVVRKVKDEDTLPGLPHPELPVISISSNDDSSRAWSAKLTRLCRSHLWRLFPVKRVRRT